MFEDAVRRQTPPPPADSRPWYDRWLDNANNFFAGFGDTLTCGLTARYRQWLGVDNLVDRNSGLYVAGQVAGTVESMALGAVNPCGLGAAGTAIRALNGVQAVGNALNMGENIQNGNYGAAAWDGVGLLGNIGQMSRACFAAGTPLLTPEGSKPIEEFRVGDLLLSAPEDDPNGAIGPRRVEHVFQRHCRLLLVRVMGQEIHTTAEHPFHVVGKGWTPASLLAAGELLRSHEGRAIAVEFVTDTGQEATVYNMRIADYHTYFVGSASWGFSVWSHNTCTTISRENGQTTIGIQNKFPAGSLESRQLQRFVAEWNKEILKAGGSMITRGLSLAEKAASKAWTKMMRLKYPSRFAGRVVGHLPDAAAGGAAVPARGMALLPSVNSYLGGLLRGIPTGTRYNGVNLFR